MGETNSLVRVMCERPRIDSFMPPVGTNVMAQKGIGLGFVGIGFDDRSSFHWFKAANVLERSYRALLREAQAGQKRWRDLAPAPEGGTGEIPRRANRSYWSAMERLEMIRPAAMLAGMSIECTLKGIIAIHQSPPKTSFATGVRWRQMRPLHLSRCMTSPALYLRQP